MKRHFPWVAAALIAATTFAAAQVPNATVHNGSSRDTLVVTPAWLAQHLHDPNLVVLQVGDKDTYDAGHIPGARFCDWMDLHVMTDPVTGLSVEMPPLSDLHDALESLGVSDGSRVIIAASGGQWSQSTRVLLTFDYAGLSNVSFLDGGLTGWTQSGQPTSKEAPLAKRGHLAPLKARPIIVDVEFVKAHERTPHFAIVDGRATAFYDGTRPGGKPPTPGHIPGALSAPFDSFATGDGQLKTNAEIQAVFDKAGVKPGDTIIGYCHIGQQATAMLFAARTLGHDVLLYDGSFQDWSKRGLPVETK
jgi:thiosulfate/3-mercaptopyruvate sulfurtransferase